MKSRNINNRNLALLAFTTLVVTACGGGGDGGYMEPPPPPPVNTAPSISAITDKVSDQDSVIGPIEFSVTDRESDASLLTVSASLDGAAVVPADGLTLAGNGAVRTITLTPLEAATGPVSVSLAVTDPQGAVTTRTFGVTVNARSASIREWSLTTFAKAETDEVTPMNGFTFTQDADDAAIFEPLIGTGEE
jgi:hypothetical protein